MFGCFQRVYIVKGNMMGHNSGLIIKLQAVRTLIFQNICTPETWDILVHISTVYLSAWVELNATLIIFGEPCQKYFEIQSFLLAFKCIPYSKFFLQTLFKENLGLIFGFPYQFNGRARLTVISVLQLFICKLLFICSLAVVHMFSCSQ